MKRHRFITNTDECVNPIYHKEWGYPVTVKDSIEFCFQRIVDAAYKKISKYNLAFIIFEKREMSKHIIQFIQNMCNFNNPNIKIIVEDTYDSDDEYEKRAIPVKFVSFTPTRPKYAIPYYWNDAEPDWTWKDVISYGPPSGSSSSTSIWPPLEYKITAQKELIRKLEKRNIQLSK